MGTPEERPAENRCTVGQDCTGDISASFLKGRLMCYRVGGWTIGWGAPDIRVAHRMVTSGLDQAISRCPSALQVTHLANMIWDSNKFRCTAMSCSVDILQYTGCSHMLRFSSMCKSVRAHASVCWTNLRYASTCQHVVVYAGMWYHILAYPSR